jgi:hypothetical protein
MRTNHGKLLILLGASLLAGLRARADGSALPIVDFGSGTSGQCILGLIDDPEPLPNFYKGLQSASWQVTLGPRGEVYLKGPSMQCGQAGDVAMVMWETASALGTEVLLRYAHDGAWSDPAVLTDHPDSEVWEVPAPSSGTVRLSVGSIRQEGTMTASTLAPRPFAAPASRLAPRKADPEDGPPAVLVSPVTGATVVVWSRRSGAGFDLVASTFARGAWTEPRIVAGSPQNERDPQLVAAPDGTAYLLYWVDGPAPRVLVRQASADLSAWSAPTPVSGDGEIASRPAGIVRDGVLHVVYERHDLGLGRAPTTIVLARRDGDAWRPEILAVSWSKEALRPIAHIDGAALWVDWDDGDGALGSVRMDSTGRWEPPRYERAVRALALP